MGAKPTSLYGARVSADGTRIAYSEYHVAKDERGRLGTRVVARKQRTFFTA